MYIEVSFVVRLLYHSCQQINKRGKTRKKPQKPLVCPIFETYSSGVIPPCPGVTGRPGASKTPAAGSGCGNQRDSEEVCESRRPFRLPAETPGFFAGYRVFSRLCARRRPCYTYLTGNITHVAAKFPSLGVEPCASLACRKLIQSGIYGLRPII